MSHTKFALLGATLAAACSLGGPVWSQSCMDRITELEKNTSMKQEAAGPAITGALQPSAAGDTSSAPSSAAATNRIPANRPATSDTVAAQTEATASAQGAQTSAERLPATRPPSAETRAAEVQSSMASNPAGGTASPGDMNRVMAALAEAKSLAQQGREADCLGALSRGSMTK